MLLLQFPLPEVIVVHAEESFLSQIKRLESYVLEELNVKKLTLCNNKAQFDVHLKAQPNPQALGSKFKLEFKNIANAIKVGLGQFLVFVKMSVLFLGYYYNSNFDQFLQSLNDAQIEECLAKKGIELCGHWISADEMFITYDVGGGDKKDLEAACDGPVLTILNTKADQSMLVSNRNLRINRFLGQMPNEVVSITFSQFLHRMRVWLVKLSIVSRN